MRSFRPKCRITSSGHAAGLDGERVAGLASAIQAFLDGVPTEDILPGNGRPPRLRNGAGTPPGSVNDPAFGEGAMSEQRETPSDHLEDLAAAASVLSERGGALFR